MAWLSTRKTFMLGLVALSGKVALSATLIAGLRAGTHWAVHGPVPEISARKALAHYPLGLVSTLWTLGALMSRLTAGKTNFIFGYTVPRVVAWLTASVANRHFIKKMSNKLKGYVGFGVWGLGFGEWD